jgi:hypothetical protein
MTKKLEWLIKISTLRDVQLKLVEAQLENIIIPEVIYEIIKNLEDNYNKEYNKEKDEQK